MSNQGSGRLVAEGGNNVPDGWAWGNSGVSDAGSSYSFTIANGAVTAEDIVLHNGHTHTVALSGNDGFTVGAGTVTETIALGLGTETVQYALEDGSTTLYQIVGRSFTLTDPTGALPDGGTLTYDFTLSNGAVTGVSETITFGSSTATRIVHVPVDAVFAAGTGTITESWVSGNQIETVTYTQQQGGTGYVISTVGDSLVQANGATTALDVRPADQALFTVDSTGAVTAAQLVGPGGKTVAVTPNDHVSFSELATGYVEAVVGSGNHAHFIVYYDGAGNGAYTEVAHGTGSAVDLVGLKAQIAELPTAIAAAI